jgi:hypothetical protein
MLKSLFVNKTAIRHTILAVALAATTLPVAAFATTTHGADGPAMAAMGMYLHGKAPTHPTPSTRNRHGADGPAMAAMGMSPNGKPQTHPTPSTAKTHRADGPAQAKHRGIAAGNGDKDGNRPASHTRASTPHL